MPWESPETIHVPAITPEQIEAKIAAWNEAQRNQAYWRVEELKLRNEVSAACFNTGVEEGTEYYNLPNDYRLKSVKKTTYKLNSEKVEEALESFSDVTAALLVKWSADLSVSNYKKLTDEEKTHFNDCLDTKPGLPTLELVEPKAKP